MNYHGSKSPNLLILVSSKYQAKCFCLNLTGQGLRLHIPLHLCDWGSLKPWLVGWVSVRFEGQLVLITLVCGSDMYLGKTHFQT